MSMEHTMLKLKSLFSTDSSKALNCNNVIFRLEIFLRAKQISSVGNSMSHKEICLPFKARLFYTTRLDHLLIRGFDNLVGFSVNQENKVNSCFDRPSIQTDLPEKHPL